MSLNKNLIEIEKDTPNLARKIREHQFSPDADMRFENALSGDVNLVYNNINIHSTENPQQEATNELNKLQNKGKKNIVVIVGLGLGYLFKRVFISTTSKIIIYEPNLDILRLTFEAVDFSAELADERVKVASTWAELTEMLSQIYSYKDDVTFRGLLSSTLLYPAEADRIATELPGIMNMLTGNFATLFKNSYEWLSNGLGNIWHFEQYNNIDVLKNALKGKPAIIVSPGPSMNRNIEAIKQNRNKVIVFCVNTACKILKKHGIKPDFVVITDSLKSPAGFLIADNDISNSILIAQSIVWRELFNRLDTFDKFVFFSKNDLISRWLSDLTDFSIEEYANKGTVSYCAMYSAFMMGCNPIIMTGQDLAYTNGEFYSSSSLYGGLCTLDNGQVLKSSEIDETIKNTIKGHEQTATDIIEAKVQSLQTSPIVKVKGQNGEMLETNPHYESFIRYFEEFAAQKSFEDLKLINCSPGGAQIEGFSNEDLTEVLETLPNLEENLHFIVKKISQNSENPISKNKQRVVEGLNSIASSIQKSAPCVKLGLENAKNLLKELRRPNKDFKKIRRLTNISLEHYKTLNEELFDKHQLLISFCWKELTEMSLLMDEENEVTLEVFGNIAKVLNDLFSECETKFPEILGLCQWQSEVLLQRIKSEIK